MIIYSVKQKQQQNMHLHLDRLAIDELDARHQRVEHYGGFLARVHDDRVDFAPNLDRGVHAFVDVNHVVHFRVFHNQVMIAFLEFLQQR